KSNFLNPAVRIPLIVSTPETRSSSAAGKLTDAPVELFDVGPTLADFASAKIDYPNFTRSLAALLQNSKAESREFAVSEFAHEMMYLDRDWKLMLNRQNEPYRLFDL